MKQHEKELREFLKEWARANGCPEDRLDEAVETAKKAIDDGIKKIAKDIKAGRLKLN